MLLSLAVAATGFGSPASPLVAVIASGSRYWHNYRHSSNALVFYHALRRLGVADRSIALFLAGDSHACDSRNTARCTVHNGLGPASLVPGGGSAALPVEVDFAGSEASAEALLRVLSGRLEPGAPGAGALPGMDEGQGARLRLLLVLTGHGGDGFLKFHDKDELGYMDLAGALLEAHALGRYGRLLIIADTCQAASLGEALRLLRVPSATLLTSSLVGQNSYATPMDAQLAVSLADGFSRAAGGLLGKAVEGKGAWRARAQRRASRAAQAGSSSSSSSSSSSAPGNRTSLGEACRAAGAAALPLAACQHLLQWQGQRQWGGREDVDALYAGSAIHAGVPAGVPVRELLKTQGWVDDRSQVTIMHTDQAGEAHEEGGEESLLHFFAP